MPAEMHVVVTATRVPTPADEVLAPVVVIDRATIERSNAGDAAELLRFHAGLDLAATADPASRRRCSSAAPRATTRWCWSTACASIRARSACPALQNIAPDMIERIEVVKGPRSALWGSDAIGGVVNVVTRRGSQDGWSAEAGYGDYDTQRAEPERRLRPRAVRGTRFRRVVDRTATASRPARPTTSTAATTT